MNPTECNTSSLPWELTEEPRHLVLDKAATVGEEEDEVSLSHEPQQQEPLQKDAQVKAEITTSDKEEKADGMSKDGLCLSVEEVHAFTR